VKRREALSLAGHLSWTMLFSLLLPLLIGIWLDTRLGSSPLFFLVGAVLGILAATVGVARMAIRLFAQTAGEDPAHEQGANGEEEAE
jgi:F0F1-type ATP synthase assembly protein I